MKSRLIVPVAAVLVIMIGVLLRVAHDQNAAQLFWMVGLAVSGAPILWSTLVAARHGKFATDIVASLSIVGALALDQPIPGLVIVLMQSGGEALERLAEGRASAAVRALEEAAPRIAHRVTGERVEDVPVSAVRVGDELLVRPGDMIPCDGVVSEGVSELDTSSLTGEARPVPAGPGSEVMSGSLNGFAALRMRASAIADESQYARIVHLVRTAQASKAPLQRLADKYAVWFTPLTIVLCGVAFLLTHDWTRVLAILVVATPCPLILATPVAIVGGVNRGARRHIIVRNGGALERIGKVQVAVFDKTGTLTIGKPHLNAIHPAPGFSAAAVLQYAAAVEQGSSHLLARVIVEQAEGEGLPFPRGSEHVESPGSGVAGIVEGHAVRVGARSFVVPECEHGLLDAAALEHTDAMLRAYVAIDGQLAGVIEFADQVRPELPAVLDHLRGLGINRIVLLSGDHAPIARALAEKVGIDETYGDLLPAEKAAFVERLRAEGGSVMMVGDGINDAPALTSADVGVALAGHGGGITAEAADIIVLVDSLDRVTDAITIGRRTLRIAKQSILTGLGLSGVFMLVAAFGGIPPVIGAALQEVVDVAVILNALRSAREPRQQNPYKPATGSPTRAAPIPDLIAPQYRKS